MNNINITTHLAASINLYDSISFRLKKYIRKYITDRQIIVYSKYVPSGEEFRFRKNGYYVSGYTTKSSKIIVSNYVPKLSYDEDGERIIELDSLFKCNKNLIVNNDPEMTKEAYLAQKEYYALKSLEKDELRYEFIHCMHTEKKWATETFTKHHMFSVIHLEDLKIQNKNLLNAIDTYYDGVVDYKIQMAREAEKESLLKNPSKSLLKETLDYLKETNVTLGEGDLLIVEKGVEEKVAKEWIPQYLAYAKNNL